MPTHAPDHGMPESTSATRPGPTPAAAPDPPAQAPSRSPSPASASPSRSSSSPGREAFFDNAKYLAIVLVAVAHSWEPFLGASRSTSALYLFVYTFHMPAFILVSGHFSRTFDASPHRLRRLVAGVAVPYLLFQAAYLLFDRSAGDDPGQAFDLLNPWWVMWFLVALFVWRLAAPLWRVVRRPVVLALVIAACAAATPGMGEVLDLERVLQFLPFFVLGMRLRPEHFALLDRRAVRLTTLPVAAGALAFAYWAVPRMNEAWLYHSDTPQQLGTPWWVAMLMQPALFCCSLLLTACFLAWVPRRTTWFTALGAGTLYGYLLHGFLLKGARFWGWYDMGWVSSPYGKVAVSVAAAVVITLLCTPPVRRAFRFAVEPRMRWAFRTT